MRILEQLKLEWTDADIQAFRSMWMSRVLIPDNAAMHDSLNHKRGKVAYCEQCDKKIFNMEEVEG